MNFELANYRKDNQPLFESLNLAWLNKYFDVEPIDLKVLSDPEKYIIKPGGSIYFVQYNNSLIGTAALKVENESTLELTKMAVDQAYQGIGAGHFLCEKVIQKAKETGCQRLILYSNTKLQAAINIYYKLGFQTIPLEEGVYKRADIKMQINF
ncbi:MAG: hypothetical protein NVSMB45_17160 [Ginsengibacter sp.]